MYLQDEDWARAAKLAFEMRHPGRLLAVVRQALERGTQVGMNGCWVCGAHALHACALCARGCCCCCCRDRSWDPIPAAQLVNSTGRPAHPMPPGARMCISSSSKPNPALQSTCSSTVCKPAGGPAHPGPPGGRMCIAFQQARVDLFVLVVSPPAGGPAHPGPPGGCHERGGPEAVPGVHPVRVLRAGCMQAAGGERGRVGGALRAHLQHACAFLACSVRMHSALRRACLAGM